MPKPSIISFYGYNGGTGRTLLAANMAIALAREGKTLLWDLNVEAPGLHNVSALRAGGITTPGFFDWLLGWQKKKSRPPTPRDLKKFSEMVCSTPFSQLFILPAHGDEADPAALYFGIDWDRLMGGLPPPGHDLFNELFEQLGRDGFQHVLIDTPSGLTDLGALLAGSLPDATVLVGNYGQQSLKGLSRVYEALSDLDKAVRPGDKLRLFPVASLIPQDDADSLAAGRERWSQTFGIVDLSAFREIRFDSSLAFSESLLITQPDLAIAKDYERVYRDLSQFLAARATSSTAEVALRFQDQVANVMQLMGYSIVRKQREESSVVDFVASIESGLDTLTYFVGCQEDGGVISEGALGKLTTALAEPSSSALHARGMVVAKTLSATAQAVAEASGISAITLHYLDCRLLSFDKYLSKIVSDFQQVLKEASGVQKPVVQLAENELPEASMEDLISDGLEWAGGRNRRLCVVLNDHRKMAFTKRFAYELAKRAREDSAAPVPIRVDLREYLNKVTLEEVLAEHWLKETGQRKDPAIFLHLIKRGRIVLLLDAFDEMGAVVAGHNIGEQFRSLVKVTMNPGDTEVGNRVLVTCRVPFFEEHREALKNAINSDSSA